MGICSTGGRGDYTEVIIEGFINFFYGNYTAYCYTKKRQNPVLPADRTQAGAGRLPGKLAAMRYFPGASG